MNVDQEEGICEPCNVAEVQFTAAPGEMIRN